MKKNEKVVFNLYEMLVDVQQKAVKAAVTEDEKKNAEIRLNEAMKDRDDYIDKLIRKKGNKEFFKCLVLSCIGAAIGGFVISKGQGA